jgi:hypothetical protein
MNSRLHSSAWPIEGASHDDVSREALYTNRYIESFLDGHNQTFLVASKGMGKTLLLRSKKKALEESREGYLIIPRNQEYDDPSLNISLNTKLKKLKEFKEIQFWDAVWQISIMCSVLSHQDLCGSAQSRQTFEDKLSRFSGQLEKMQAPAFCNDLILDVKDCAEKYPSTYLQTILKLDLKTLHRVRTNISVFKSAFNDLVHSGVIVLIDAFDQFLTDNCPGLLDVWRNGQIGLFLASHNLASGNHHIKVYASIRQEAFASYNGQHSEVIKGKSLILKYSENDLREMLTKAVTLYTSYSSVDDFLGVRNIENMVFQITEDAYRYIWRHSSGTPRSIMYLAKELSGLTRNPNDAETRGHEIRRIVNETSAEYIVKDYLKAQKSIFLKSLASEDMIECFFKLVCSDVLNFDSINAISREYARLTNCDVFSCHPFCELYNIGLLGTHRPNSVTSQSEQYFVKPHRFEWKQSNTIVRDSIYFLHPALHAAVGEYNSSYRVNHRCRQTKGFVIGDGCNWPFEDQSELFPELFISHANIDKETIKSIFLPELTHYLSLLIPFTIWLDEWNIRTGQNINQEVERGIQKSQLVILFLSRDSIKSSWVEQEWRTKHSRALENKQVGVIPILLNGLDKADIPEFLRNNRYERFNPSGKGDVNFDFRKLAKDIYFLLGKNAGTS